MDTNELIVTDNGNNTIVTVPPLGGTLQRVYFEPLIRPVFTVGTFQQATLVGDYPSVGGVLLSSYEPGVDPATFAAPVYSSSNPNVATVDTNGMVTAVNAGTAKLTARVGLLNSTNSVTITVTPVVPAWLTVIPLAVRRERPFLIRLVGGWNGTLAGGYTLSGGQINLDGSSGYVSLPAGILSGVNEVAIETWVTLALPSIRGQIYLPLEILNLRNGENYISMQPIPVVEPHH